MTSNPDEHNTPLWLMIAMVLSVLGTLVFSLFIVNAAPDLTVEPVGLMAPNVEQTDEPANGVTATLSAEAITVTRRMPTLAFSVRPSESLDARLPVGPFEGRFAVRFNAGAVRRAQIGATLRNGSLIIRLGDRMLLQDHAGDEPRLALTTLPVSLPTQWIRLEYEFIATGDGPHAMRAVWQPDGSLIPLPLPAEGAALVSSDAMRGMVLVAEHNCVTCHQSEDAARHERLAVSPGPVLGQAGARLRPAWIRRWLADPTSISADTTMPATLHQLSENERNQAVEALTQFLVSMGGPMPRDEERPAPEHVTTGMVLYHQVGCVACHGPLEPLENLPGGRTTHTQVFEQYTGLPNLAEKTSIAALTRFLIDPVRHRPSGRMPSMNLTEFEAGAIAAYLIDNDLKRSGTPADGSLAINDDQVMRGRERFASLGCADCHHLGDDRTVVESTTRAPSLESLAGSSEGCLAETPSPRAPHFSFSARQRASIRAFLDSLDDRRNEHVPLDDLALTMTRLNCTACHSYDDERGPEPGITTYFESAVEADLGDEGRIPPTLSDVGAKLNPGWMREVLEAVGQARPYLAVRMPQFGAANVHELPDLFAAAAGATSEPIDEPAFLTRYAELGRHLVGSKGLNCIQCHTIADRDATGTPGPNLAYMVERLRYPSFTRWLHDPSALRSGTRMPSFFMMGQSGITDILGGHADDQIDAMWTYLSQGEHLPLPEGLPDPGGLMLTVGDEPIVFRTFMNQAGVRAIACGFPEQVHCAFNADRCEMAAIWNGEFLNASGAWANRGGTETNPQSVTWLAPDDRRTIASVTTGDGTVVALQPHFKGYRLDEQRRPVFIYDLKTPDESIVISVEEQPLPAAEGDQFRLVRRFTIEGPADGSLGLNLNGHRLVGDDDATGSASVRLNPEGRVQFDLELTWRPNAPEREGDA